MLCAFSCALVVFLCAAFIISSFISLAVIVPVVLLCALRFYFILPNRSRTRVKQRDSSSKCSLAVFLGSGVCSKAMEQRASQCSVGGHTSEALTLLESLDFTRYTPRTYIVCEGDESSADKARRLEDTKTSSYLFSDDHEAPYKILRIPRAREVHQPILEAPITALRSLGLCIWHVTIDTLRSGRSFSDVLIMNGPGTCFILCLAFYINKVGPRSGSVTILNAIA
jgi:beta-1,4-N-acetylglucosaminyltransferase